MDRSTSGDARTVLPFLTAFIMCCLMFSGVLFALSADETPLTEAPATDDPVVEAAAVEPAVESIAVEDATTEAASRLEEILKGNKKCLNCHNREKSKLLEDGKEMSLQVPKEPYLASAHGVVSCVSCHSAIGKIKHPSQSTNISISTEREFSVDLNESCRKCHRQKYTQYKGSVHSALVAQGNKKAPVCSSCHNPHAPVSMANYKPETGLPCKNCHENIFNAYSASVHGQARINGNTIRDSHIQAPICSDCHHSHEVTALAIGDVLRTTCINCHESVTLLHNQWLPNAGTHLDIVSCAVCHAHSPNVNLTFISTIMRPESRLPWKRARYPYRSNSRPSQMRAVAGTPWKYGKREEGLAAKVRSPISLYAAVWKLCRVSRHTRLPARVLRSEPVKVVTSPVGGQSRMSRFPSPSLMAGDRVLMPTGRF